ncbi:hypothetical protein [Streptomyces axinellae]|uniref:Uncharacterized protein n=1 Tax=Streptomyces axinellae TaxID=552788 RepID=A0ABP6CHA8_9ACTN
MPSPFERLTEKLAAGRRQSAADWLEKDIGEAERAVRDKWKRLEELGEERTRLRENYAGTDAELRRWQEQRKEIKQTFQDEQLASLRLGTAENDVLDRLTSLKLFSNRTAMNEFKQVMEDRIRQYGEDRNNVWRAVGPLADEDPPVVLPQYSAQDRSQSHSVAQSGLGMAALETLPSGAQAPDSPPPVAPPAYTPSVGSSMPPTIPAFQGPGQGSGQGHSPGQRSGRRRSSR